MAHRDPREVDRARNAIETSYWQGLESVSDRADLLNQYRFYLGDPGSITRDRERYAQVTPAEVRRWADETVDLEQRVVLRVVPEKESAAASSAEEGARR